MKKLRLLACTLAATFAFAGLSATDAQAGGYDTPILYSAKHLGMGGAAVAYVDDPSAMFHNPAGIAKVPFAEVIADFSAVIGNITASPSNNDSLKPTDANTTFAPFFLAGASVRATDWMAFGLAFYPVASAGASYEYEDTGGSIEDSTRLVFLELSPGVAFNIPGGVRIGAGYRISFVSLDRIKRNLDTDADLIHMELSGANFLGFRLGAQWQFKDLFQVGVTYRHKTETEVQDDEISAFGITGDDVTTTLVLPSKLAAGIRGNYMGFSLATDVEYTFNSQNDKSEFKGTAGGSELVLTNQFQWTDAITLRVGTEYTLPMLPLAIRLGYIWDQMTANKTYPSAFGTPPGDTHSITGGLGWDGGPWEVNLAYAYRFGSAEVTTGDLPNTDQPGSPGFEADTCAFCSFEGEYDLTMHGIYVDFAWKFELGDWTLDWASNL